MKYLIILTLPFLLSGCFWWGAAASTASSIILDIALQADYNYPHEFEQKEPGENR